MRKTGLMLAVAGAMLCGTAAMKAHGFGAADAPLAAGTTAPAFSLPSQTDKRW